VCCVRRQIFQPAFVILQSTAKPKSFWIVVRGTYSVEDILVSALDTHAAAIGIARGSVATRQALTENLCANKHMKSGTSETSW
jgi:hypothetical protein